MDYLPDEIMEKIFQQLSPLMMRIVSCVCRRWLLLTRTSTTSLKLNLSFFYTEYHLHSCLNILPNFPNLLCLELSHRSVSSSILVDYVSSSCRNLVYLKVSLYGPLTVHWLTLFPFLKEVFIELDPIQKNNLKKEIVSNVDENFELPLESLGLFGAHMVGYSMDWLWKRCKKLRRLDLRYCKFMSNDVSFASFSKCLQRIEELKIEFSEFYDLNLLCFGDWVLLYLLENNNSLTSLILRSYTTEEALNQFFRFCKSPLATLDLMGVPLDNDQISLIAKNFRDLVTLRVKRVTEEGIKALALDLSSGLEELALVNCDSIVRAPGLLAILGQNLTRLKKLDLSSNEMLLDRELESMLVFCKNLVHINLTGCKKLTNNVVISMFVNCKLLESVNIWSCPLIDSDAVFFIVHKYPRLRQLIVNISILSDVAKTWASQNLFDIEYFWAL